MTRYLWTGESEYCICGRHVTDHETCQSFIAIATQQPATVTCRGKGEGGNNNNNMSRIRIRNCHYDEFRPYRNRILDEHHDNKEVIEKQIREVRNE